MVRPDLSEEMMARTMVKANAQARSGDARCYTFADPLHEARNARGLGRMDGCERYPSPLTMECFTYYGMNRGAGRETGVGAGVAG